MYGSSWSKFNKAGLAIGTPIALLSAGLLGWAWSWSAEYERQADNYTQEYTANGARKIGEACNVLVLVEKAHCLIDAESKARENQRNEQDLVAQRQSALWAYVMALAAVIGMALSALGVMLVWITFRETKKANGIARAAMESHVRAWLRMTVQILDFQRIGSTMKASIAITAFNAGNAPANFVSVVPVILDGLWTTPRILNARGKFFRSQNENLSQNLHDRILFQGEEWSYRCDVEATNFPDGERFGSLAVFLGYDSPTNQGARTTTRIFDIEWRRETPIIGDVGSEFPMLVERESFSAYAD